MTVATDEPPPRAPRAGTEPATTLARIFGSTRAGWPIAAVIVLACHACWQGHGVIDPAFRNPDVAGIAYDARLLLDGALPYVASAEIKPPGAFLMFAPLIALGGMRAVWAAAVLWGSALSFATGALARAAWGRGAGPRAAVLHAACAAIASDGDINYSFWMATPFTLAAASAVAATLTPNTRRAALLWLTSGFTSMLAVAIKPSAWPVCLLFAGLLARDVLRGEWLRAVRAAFAGLAGALLVAVLIALPYALAGELGGLRAGLDDVAKFGGEYVAVVARALGGRFHAVLAGLPCLVEQIPGLLALAVLGMGELFPRRRPAPPLALGAWLFAVAALVGVTYTLRFYSHDNVQLWPALAVLAVRPAGLVARVLDRCERVRFAALGPAVSLFATLGCGLAAAWPGFDQRWGYVHFMAERDHLIQDICREVAPRLPANEPVLGWGWSAWSVYEHCERRAPGRIFKVMASVTTVNTNTCNNGFGPMVLRSDASPARFFAEVERRPPSLFLWSNYFAEMGGDPLDDFTPLRALIKARYSIVDARGPFVALLRSDLLPEAPSVLTRGEPATFERRAVSFATDDAEPTRLATDDAERARFAADGAEHAFTSSCVARTQ
jgi:hypothetical protein